MFSFVIALMFAIQAPTQPAAQDEIKDGLLRAESLFYEAKFIESIQLLAHVNDVLQTKPGRLPDKIATKLQLALANIGLNDTASAKSFLTELYALDPDYVLDAKQFSPKVVALANDAKNDQNKSGVRKQETTHEELLPLETPRGSRRFSGTMKPKCPELAEVEPETAELLYKTGLAQYKQEEFPQALESFRSALKLSPKARIGGSVSGAHREQACRLPRIVWCCNGKRTSMRISSRKPPRTTDRSFRLASYGNPQTTQSCDDGIPQGIDPHGR